MKYSIIFLLEKPNEELLHFMRNLNDLLLDRQESFEILIIAKGTGNFLRDKLDDLLSCNDGIKAFEFETKTTQAVCLKAAFRESAGEIIVACGPYQQITNDSFAKLLESLDAETDIVTPWRELRIDGIINRTQSRVFNAIIRAFVGTGFHDLSCTVKVFRRDVLDQTEIYGNMYRFLPVLAQRKGFKAKEVKCEQYRGGNKVSFYGDVQKLSNYFTRLIDIFVLFFNTRFTRKPLRFFSAIGMTFFSTGLLITAYIFAQKLFLSRPMGGRPLLLVAILAMIMGLQVASIGLLGEIIAFTHGRNKKEYTIEKII